MKNLEDKNKQTKKGNYLTIKESRQIIKHNIKQMKYYEDLKKKKNKRRKWHYNQKLNL